MLIGLYGKKQSGKSTSAKYLKEQILQIRGQSDSLVQIVNFADSLKEMIHNLFGVPLNILNGTDEEKNTPFLLKNAKVKEFQVAFHDFITADMELKMWETNTVKVSPRKLMEWVGFICRAVNQECFINATMQKINNADHTIIADVRMENEVRAILQHGGWVIYLDRNKSVSSSVPSEQASSDTLLAIATELNTNKTVYIPNEDRDIEDRNYHLDVFIKENIQPSDDHLGIYK